MRKPTLIISGVGSMILLGCLLFTPFSTQSPLSSDGNVKNTPTSPKSNITPQINIPNTGSAGLGDEFYPGLGNGGYEVESYLIIMDVNMMDRSIAGSTELLINPLQHLAAFYVDIYGLNVRTVTVDAVAVEFGRHGAELLIYLDQLIRPGNQISVVVSYDGFPSGVPDPVLPLDGGIGWMNLPSGAYTINEPLGSMGWFPCNNYPIDKATYQFVITVEKPYAVAANGVLTQTLEQGSTRTFFWEMNDPMSSYLASISIGDFIVREDTSRDGVIIRSYFARSLDEETIKQFDQVPEMLDFYSDLIAPYPFDAYGVVVMAEDVGVAMENQSLSTFGADMAFEEAIVHELAHQWYGDSVTLSSWPDIWLNEGFATYMEALWFEHSAGKSAYTGYISSMYEQAQTMMAPGNVPNESMFSWSVYVRGALVLHALRTEVGDDIFFNILREYYDRYVYSNASTEDFMNISEEICLCDLDSLFTGWLYSDTVPTFP